jgi:uncharacterized protein (DUF2384 family)
MSGYGVVPGPAELKNMLDRGMTHQEIADEVHRRTGHSVTRNAITMAIKRGGVEHRGIDRYEDLIPWRVRDVHSRHYALAILRLEARRRRDKRLSPEEEKRLASWLAKLMRKDLVVYYEPDSTDGFYLIPRRTSDSDIIRQPEG